MPFKETNFGESVLFWKAFCRELRIAIRFGLVGIVATAVHILVVWALLRQTEITPILANTLAFLTAFGISFTGNYFWTFPSPGSQGQAIRRFFLISVSAFVMNTLLLTFLVRGGWFPPLFRPFSQRQLSR